MAEFTTCPLYFTTCDFIGYLKLERWRNVNKVVDRSKTMNFENVYGICKDDEVLRKFLNDNELLGDYSGICNKCFKGSVYLRQDKSFSKDGLSWRW